MAAKQLEELFAIPLSCYRILILLHHKFVHCFYEQIYHTKEDYLLDICRWEQKYPREKLS